MVKRASMRNISENLAVYADINGTVWDLREMVCSRLKEDDYLDKNADCSENQNRIDAIIKKLVDEV